MRIPHEHSSAAPLALPPDPNVGRRIGDFRIVTKLAAGGQGSVYRAQHVEVAQIEKVIKLLRPEFARNEQLRARFKREAEAAAKLNHKYILGIENFGVTDDGQPFLIVPLLDGQSLQTYLETRGPLPPHRAFYIVAQVSNALDWAHGLGVIHRDIKPDNIFIENSGDNAYAVKLLDFGIAKVLQAPSNSSDGVAQTLNGASLGTPGYMPPEQHGYADEVTPAADVYSLSVTIWQMVTGTLPWHPDDFTFPRSSPQRPPVDVMPAEWTDILLKGMATYPGDRPQSVRELALALASALPAIGRVPSGAEILAQVVRRFVQQAAPTDETIRNAAEVDRTVPLLWPIRETAVVRGMNPPAPTSTPRERPRALGTDVVGPVVRSPSRSSVEAANDSQDVPTSTDPENKARAVAAGPVAGPSSTTLEESASADAAASHAPGVPAFEGLAPDCPLVPSGANLVASEEPQVAVPAAEGAPSRAPARPSHWKLGLILVASIAITGVTTAALAIKLSSDRATRPAEHDWAPASTSGSAMDAYNADRSSTPKPSPTRDHESVLRDTSDSGREGRRSIASQGEGSASAKAEGTETFDVKRISTPVERPRSPTRSDARPAAPRTSESRDAASTLRNGSAQSPVRSNGTNRVRSESAPKVFNLDDVAGAEE